MRFEAPQRGAAYQPRVQPWVDVAPHSGVLKERRIDIDHTHVLRLDTNLKLSVRRREIDLRFTYHLLRHQILTRESPNLFIIR